MEAIVAAVIGIVVGGAVCWLVQSYRAKGREAGIEAEHRETVAELRGQLSQAESAQQILETAKEQLRETFQATASQALQASNSQFLDLAQENLGKTLEAAKGDFKQRHEQFEALVKPLTQNYDKLNPQIESLIQQSQSLATETGKLSNALTDNRQIGSWGEVQLRRVVELAGMQEYCDFAEQNTGADSQFRPDLTVRLPEDRTVVVDAKASTAAYLDAQQSEDEAQRDTSLKRHAGALKSQVDELAKKEYGAQVEGSLDFVVMFVPGDQFLAAALSAQPGLIEYAMGRRVAIATPASLISLLWAVANGWQRHRIAESAEEIQKEAVELHGRMLKFIDYYQDVGKRLNSAVDAFNRSVGSFDNRVIPQGRKFSELAIGKEDDFTLPSIVEKQARASRYAEETQPRLPENSSGA